MKNLQQQKSQALSLVMSVQIHLTRLKTTCRRQKLSLVLLSCFGQLLFRFNGLFSSNGDDGDQRKDTNNTRNPRVNPGSKAKFKFIADEFEN